MLAQAAYTTRRKKQSIYVQGLFYQVLELHELQMGIILQHVAGQLMSTPHTQEL